MSGDNNAKSTVFIGSSMCVFASTYKHLAHVYTDLPTGIYIYIYITKYKLCLLTFHLFFSRSIDARVCDNININVAVCRHARGSPRKAFDILFPGRRRWRNKGKASVPGSFTEILCHVCVVDEWIDKISGCSAFCRFVDCIDDLDYWGHEAIFLFFLGKILLTVNRINGEEHSNVKYWQIAVIKNDF